MITESQKLYNSTEQIYYWVQSSYSTYDGGVDGMFEVIRGMGTQRTSDRPSYAGGICIALCKDEKFANRLCVLLKEHGAVDNTETGKKREKSL